MMNQLPNNADTSAEGLDEAFQQLLVTEGKAIADGKMRMHTRNGREAQLDISTKVLTVQRGPFHEVVSFVSALRIFYWQRQGGSGSQTYRLIGVVD